MNWLNRNFVWILIFLFLFIQNLIIFSLQKAKEKPKQLPDNYIVIEKIEPVDSLMSRNDPEENIIPLMPQFDETLDMTKIPGIFDPIKERRE